MHEARVNESFYLIDRAALDDATELMTRFGRGAAGEAAARANRSRDLGNLVGFCRWRQISRAIAGLSVEHVTGTVH